MQSERTSRKDPGPTFLTALAVESFLFATMSHLEFAGKMKQYGNIGEINGTFNGLIYAGMSIFMGVGFTLSFISVVENRIMRSLKSIRLD